MTTLPIPFSRGELDLAKDILRRAIIQDMNQSTTTIAAGTRARDSDSAVRTAIEKNGASHCALLALLDHLNSFHFQRSQ